MAAELKFLVSPAVAGSVREWMRHHLDADPHGTGPHHDDYTTTSLYTDTPEHHVAARVGSYARAKYRVRRYGMSAEVFLERKLRTNTVLCKRRERIALEVLSERVAHPSTRMESSGAWFAQRLCLRRLAPVCEVAYERTARTLQTPHGHARLTVDGALRARIHAAWTFSVGTHMPILAEHQIIEMKFQLAMPTLFKQALAEFNLAPVSLSKYRLAAERLNLLAPDAFLESA